MSLSIAGIQMTEGNVNCNVPNLRVEKTFNNFEESIYNSIVPIVFPVSANSDDYSINITLWGRGDVWQDLLNKELELFNAIKLKISQGYPINIQSDNGLPVYLNHDNVSIWMEGGVFNKRATDGISFISFELSGVVNGLVTINNGIGSLPIASFVIGSA